MGETVRSVERTREINERMPAYVAQRVIGCLNEEGKSLKGSRVFILGATYKPDVADARESPAIEILSRLQRIEADVSFRDPYIPELVVVSAAPLGEGSVLLASHFGYPKRSSGN